MLFIFSVGLLILFSCLLYLGYYFIKKIMQQDQTFPKKQFFSIFIGGILLFVIGASFSDTTNTQEINELQLDNETLNTEVLELKSEIKEYKTSFEESEEEIIELTDSISSKDGEIKKLEKEKNKLKKDVKKLKKDNEKLSDDVSGIEGDNKSLKDENKKLKEKQSENTSNNSTAQGSSNPSDSSESNAGNTDSVDSSGDCDIKGSENGIYHIPGSTYYSRTTNVVEWFCSEEDARNAGYIAPKR